VEASTVAVSAFILKNVIYSSESFLLPETRFVYSENP